MKKTGNKQEIEEMTKKAKKTKKITIKNLQKERKKQREARARVCVCACAWVCVCPCLADMSANIRSMWLHVGIQCYKNV
jgi:hypothetical protein